MPGNKHSGIKYIKNHILQTSGGLLLHRMSPDLLLLSCSKGIISSFYFLIHVFSRFEIARFEVFDKGNLLEGSLSKLDRTKNKEVE
jgi:hypothetical protein